MSNIPIGFGYLSCINALVYLYKIEEGYWYFSLQGAGVHNWVNTNLSKVHFTPYTHFFENPQSPTEKEWRILSMIDHSLYTELLSMYNQAMEVS